MTESVKSSSSFPAPAANSQKQNEKKARPTLEERLQALLRSTTPVRQMFLVGGTTKVGVVYNPQGGRFTVAPMDVPNLPTTTRIVLVTNFMMRNAIRERFSRTIAAAGLTPVIYETPEIRLRPNGPPIPIFAAFGFMA